jgi:citronellol/citronellal dehydrogenase
MEASEMTGALHGKTVLITGASRGIGEALAIRFAREGAVVIATARTAEPGSRLPGSLSETIGTITAKGDQAVAVPADLSHSSERRRLVEAAEEAVGPIDILVNNAAVSWSHPIIEFPRKHFDLMWEMQVCAPVELAQLIVPGMLKRGRGWVLNVSSRASEHPVGAPDPLVPFTAGSTVYGMCKAALERFTTGLASEVHGQGIAVNSLAPSRVVATWGTEHHGLVPPGRPDLVEFPEEFAEAALALCSGDPATLTGRTTLTDTVIAELELKVLDLNREPFTHPVPIAPTEQPPT